MSMAQKAPCESCGSTVWGAHHAHCEKAGKKILKPVEVDGVPAVEVEQEYDYVAEKAPDRFPPEIKLPKKPPAEQLIIHQSDQDIEIDTMSALIQVMEDAFRRGLGYSQADRISRWFSEKYEEES